MPKYFVDFEFTGHIEVDSKTAEEAKEMVEKVSVEELIENTQHFRVGRHYIEKATNRKTHIK